MALISCFPYLVEWVFPATDDKPVRPVYRRLGLDWRSPSKKRLPCPQAMVVEIPPSAHIRWSVDLMTDSCACSQRVGTLNLIDDFNGVVLPIEIDTS